MRKENAAGCFYKKKHLPRKNPMEIIRFSSEHLQDATRLAMANYEEERAFVRELPEITDSLRFPKLNCFAENGLGVAAYENGKMLGFLCCFEPWKGAFDMIDSLGTFCPVHAHAAVKDNRARIYQRMYEAAAKTWAERKILGHAIGMYAHDHEGIRAFFEYGFGQRCADQLRAITPVYALDMENKASVTNTVLGKTVSFRELAVSEFPKVRKLRRSLDNHMKESPCFMQSTADEFEQWLSRVEAGNRRTFVAEVDGQPIAYLDVTDSAETFVTYHPQMANINGAYCQPEYRGCGISKDLLDYVQSVLSSEGFSLLGVDNESYNPTAAGFWRKHFTAYTCSVVRRIEVWAANYV